MIRIIVFSTSANGKEAKKIAQELLKSRLVACVNVVPITYYWWKNKIRNVSERLLVMKTRAKLSTELQRRIRALNSYVCLRSSP